MLSAQFPLPSPRSAYEDSSLQLANEPSCWCSSCCCRCLKTDHWCPFSPPPSPPTAKQNDGIPVFLLLFILSFAGSDPLLRPFVLFPLNPQLSPSHVPLALTQSAMLFLTLIVVLVRSLTQPPLLAPQMVRNRSLTQLLHALPCVPIFHFHFFLFVFPFPLPLRSR